MKSFNAINYFKTSLLFCCVVIISSCASRKDYVYFQDAPMKITTKMDAKYELTYQSDDLLTIYVNAADPEIARPFNLPAAAFNESLLMAQGTLKMQTYLIDIRGEIEFPILGKIKLAGLTRSQATDYFKERLSEYIKEPIVIIRLANFTVTVIGDVARPGTYTMEDERVTIPEALGLAGDLNNTALRNNVFLIRETNGEKRLAKIDLTSANFLGSPLYYLSQNDVLYIEPNNAKIRSSTYNPNTAVIISAISTLATITAILLR